MNEPTPMRRRPVLLLALRTSCGLRALNRRTSPIVGRRATLSARDGRAGKVVSRPNPIVFRERRPGVIVDYGFAARFRDVRVDVPGELSVGLGDRVAGAHIRCKIGMKANTGGAVDDDACEEAADTLLGGELDPAVPGAGEDLNDPRNRIE